MKERVRVHLFVSGRVQGVMYRRHAKKKAEELNVTGWVKNLVDGRVEIAAEGKRENVEAFLEWVKEGSPLASVEHLDSSFEEYRGEFDGFAVREFGF